jgi:LPS-assembly lipoprotein
MRTLLILLPLLAACGFRPVHAPLERAESASLQQVRVDPIPAGRPGQVLQIALEDMMTPSGPPANARYRVIAAITEVKRPIIIERNAEISRYNLEMTVPYSVVEVATGQTLGSGQVRRISSYNVSNSDFSTFIGERDARERGIQEAAQEISMRVATIVENAENARP